MKTGSINFFLCPLHDFFQNFLIFRYFSFISPEVINNFRWLFNSLKITAVGLRTGSLLNIKIVKFYVVQCQINFRQGDGAKELWLDVVRASHIRSPVYDLFIGLPWAELSACVDSRPLYLDSAGFKLSPFESFLFFFPLSKSIIPYQWIRRGYVRRLFKHGYIVFFSGYPGSI